MNADVVTGAGLSSPRSELYLKGTRLEAAMTSELDRATLRYSSCRVLETFAWLDFDSEEDTLRFLAILTANGPTEGGLYNHIMGSCCDACDDVCEDDGAWQLRLQPVTRAVTTLAIDGHRQICNVLALQYSFTFDTAVARVVLDTLRAYNGPDARESDGTDSCWD